MRLPCVLLPALFLTGCFPAAPLREIASPKNHAAVAVPKPESPTPPPTAPVNPTVATSREVSGIQFEGVSFDSRRHGLVVADQAAGPGSQYADARAAARAFRGLAAVNAGFFTPQGTPLGLVISAGKISGNWNTASSLGSGVWYHPPSGIMAISRREKLGRIGAASMDELIQAGPVLVENGQSVGGLDSTKSSARSMILWDGGTRWWIGCSSPCTLAALAQALSNGQPAVWPVRHALNLDGGRSSDLWISDSIAGGPLLRRPPWNRPVRNFLILVER
jgi:hypothetical protein